MAAKEMYDFLAAAAADVDITLGAGSYEIHPDFVFEERGSVNQVVHIGDDGSEERISLSDEAVFYVSLKWEAVTEAEAGALFDLYFDAAKADGRFNSFKWAHPSDGHTYVVRFDCDLGRQYRAAGVYGVLNVVLKVLGKIAE